VSYSNDPPILFARWLGTVRYAEALALQESLVEARRRGEVPDTLLLLEHPPVITLGRSARRENVLADDAERERLGIEIHESGRGGDVTFHGPGQLVGYPILALGEGRRDAHVYLRDLEEALILTAADYGVRAERCPGLTGVWVGGRKLAAIGVRIGTGWITSHGFALNVDSDLSGFRTIVPCGLEGRGVTSLAELTGRRFPLREVAATAAARAARVLGFSAAPSEIPSERLAIPMGKGLSS
jgi:lipoyl(octanoyl) transferase